ncbi:ArnT family glycosyltransferase [Roseimaritima sediminicola]|uniref:ArnT family glycosyltransferase n=1 Tax=Roseimaritima sediminicola TaxID=2662066 RepID=UPI001387606C|nr:glycosyltransferase family 39 protein [Roseimaritima sediminicola]
MPHFPRNDSPQADMSSAANPPRSSFTLPAGFWRYGILLLLIAAVVRGLVLWQLADRIAIDVDAYRRLAEGFAATGVFGGLGEQGDVHPTAFRPPLYPILLSAFVSEGRWNDSAVLWMHLALGLFSVLGTYRLGASLLPLRAAWAAGLVVAVDPILLVHSASVMTETLAVALVVLSWNLWHRAVSAEEGQGGGPVRRWAWSLALSLSLVAAFFCRPTFLVWAGLLVAYLLWRARRAPRRGALITAGTVFVALAVAVGFWTLRNQRHFGAPIWATSHGGYTLLLGNNPLFYQYLREGRFGTAWDAEPFHRAWTQRYEDDPTEPGFWQRNAEADLTPVGVVDEVADDALAYEAAKATIRRQPAMFLWSSVVRLGRLWSPLPLATAERQGAARWIVALWYIAVLLAALWGLWRLWGRGRGVWHPTWLAGVLLCVALSGVHAVYWSNLRMRAPAMPVIALLAASVLARSKTP